MFNKVGKEIDIGLIFKYIVGILYFISKRLFSNPLLSIERVMKFIIILQKDESPGRS